MRTFYIKLYSAIDINNKPVIDIENEPSVIENIRLLFWAANIDLNIKIGSSVPSPRSKSECESLLNDFKRDQSCGHVVISSFNYNPGFEAGELFDTNKRGLALVYFNSNFISGNIDRLVQTCAHEIGHMFNLSHKDVYKNSIADKKYTSAMDETDKRRIHEPAKSWDLARKDTDGYFRAPSEKIKNKLFPFNGAARYNLNNEPDSVVFPWQDVGFKWKDEVD